MASMATAATVFDRGL